MTVQILNGDSKYLFGFFVNRLDVIVIAAEGFRCGLGRLVDGGRLVGGLEGGVGDGGATGSQGDDHGESECFDRESFECVHGRIDFSV
ncbi:hypothetical protein NC796_13225 [Aliifodinibius sp. S!AR15-10]|nr:hypothetical protein [Aliifodinibius sp. S!AR15-10]